MDTYDCIYHFLIIIPNTRHSILLIPSFIWEPLYINSPHNIYLIGFIGQDNLIPFVSFTASSISYIFLCSSYHPIYHPEETLSLTPSRWPCGSMTIAFGC